MRKAWVVAAREYRTNVRTKSFLIAVILMPIFMFGTIVVQSVMEGRVDLNTKTVALVDRTGRMAEALIAAAEERNASEGIDPSKGKPTEPRYELTSVPPEPDVDAQLLELSERVRARKLFAFIVLGEHVLDGEGPMGTTAIRYYSNEPTYRDVHRWLARVANERVRSVRLDVAGIDQKVVKQAMRPVGIVTLGLLERDATGTIQSAKEVSEFASFVVPFGLVMLMWMGMMFTIQPLLNGVLEEKMQRIAEVLLGSLPPFDLMLGKLIGYVLIALTLIAVYFAGGYFIADHLGHADKIPFGIMGWFIVFQALAVVMVGSLFLAIGASCNDLREAQNLAFPVWIPLIIPMLCMTTVIQHPSSTFSTVLSLVPLFTPMVMIMRLAVPPGPPLWQPLVGIVGTLLFTACCVWAAGRIFRVGLLMQGKPPKLMELARWVVRG